MKKLITTLLLLSMLSFGATITIEVLNIKDKEGSLFVGLFNKEEGFPKNENTYRSLVLEVNGTNMKMSFDDIPSGTYAIALYHDENNNRVLDKNLFGIPSEDYAFSNNIKPMFSAPKFEEVQFEVNTTIELSIQMNGN